MNLSKIRHAASEIERLEKARAWLTEFGTKISPNGEENVSFRPNFAGSCNGSKEAGEVLSAMMTNNLHRLIPDAINNVENTIQIHRETIRTEATE